MIPGLAILAVFACGPGPPPPDVDRDRLMRIIRELPENRAAWAGESGEAGIAGAEAIVERELRAFGDEPTAHEFDWSVPLLRDRTARTRWRNIIVDRAGATDPREVVIVSAHIDGAPQAPGADDDGTGVSALLEIARVTRTVPTRRSMRFIFFTLEEAQLAGSSAYVRDLRPRLAAPGGPVPEDLERVTAMLSLEMLGYFSDAPGSQRSPVAPIPGVFEPPTVGDFIALATTSAHARICRLAAGLMTDASPGVKVFAFDLLPIPIPDLMRSDHAPFLLAGVPALMVTDTANFRNPHYHQPTDRADTIDEARYAGVVQGLVNAVIGLAERASSE